jgi:ferredoxin/DMSO/TMAO reductase YedYZ heme-binding membrane subunit
MLRTAQDSVHLIAATIGFISYAALWAGTLWGSVLRSGWATSRLRHQTVYGIHMQLILLGLTLGVTHSIVQMVAPYGKVRAIDVVVPFIDRADPIGVGLGVFSLELMIATALSVLVQRKLGYGRWRALHSLGYLSFTMVAAHLLISGSELYPETVRIAIAASWGVVVVAGFSTVTPIARIPRAALDRLTRRHRAEEVTVSVDPGKCGSFGFCEQEAPAIFTLRSDQRLAYRSVVPSDQAEAAMRAAVVCPARAIKLGRLPATVVVSQPSADTTGVSPLAASLAPGAGAEPGLRPPIPTEDTGSFRRAAAGHTGSQPRVADTGAYGSPPRVADTGSYPRVGAGHTGSQPRVSDTGSYRVPAGSARMADGSYPHTGSQPRMPDTGSYPRPPAVETGSYPPADTGSYRRPPAVDTGSYARPPAVDSGSYPRVNGHTGPQPAVPDGALPPVGSQAGALPPVAGGAGGAGRNAGTGGPALRPVGGRGSRAQQSGMRAAGRRAAAEPPSEDPLPAPDQLQDTGRHHIPRLRGIAGGRS